MGFFRVKKSLFCSVILEADYYKICLREMGSKNRVLSEILKTQAIDDPRNIATVLDELLKEYEDKKIFLCVLMGEATQGVVKGSEVSDEECKIVTVNSDFLVYNRKDEVESIDSLFEPYKIDEHLNALKLLYFFYKNEKFQQNALFILRLEHSIAVMFADENEVFDAYMVDFVQERLNAIVTNPNDLALDDEDEVFYQTIKKQIENFYKKEGSKFVQNIFIYDADARNDANMSYYIFKNLLIKTQVAPIKVVDFMNRVNIKENG